MGVDCDQADRALGLERTEPLFHLARGQPIAASAQKLDGDQIAVLGLHAVAPGNGKLAADVLLVDRHQPAAAVGQLAENAQHAMLGLIEQFYDAAARMGDLVLVVRVLDAEQHAVADAAGDAGMGAPGDVHENFRRAAALLVPFGRHGDQFAVAVASGDVGGKHRRQFAGQMHGLAASPRDDAVIGKVAQDAFQFDAVGVLQPERAGDFTSAGLAGLRADECDDLVPGREGFRSVAVTFHYLLITFVVCWLRSK